MDRDCVMCWCSRCGTELYSGEYCYRLDGGRICVYCLAAYAEDYFRPWLEAVP